MKKSQIYASDLLDDKDFDDFITASLTEAAQEDIDEIELAIPSSSDVLPLEQCVSCGKLISGKSFQFQIELDKKQRDFKQLKGRGMNTTEYSQAAEEIMNVIAPIHQGIALGGRASSLGEKTLRSCCRINVMEQFSLPSRDEPKFNLTHIKGSGEQVGNVKYVIVDALGNVKEDVIKKATTYKPYYPYSLDLEKDFNLTALAYNEAELVLSEEEASSTEDDSESSQDTDFKKQVAIRKKYIPARREQQKKEEEEFLAMPPIDDSFKKEPEQVPRREGRAVVKGFVRTGLPGMESVIVGNITIQERHPKVERLHGNTVRV